MAADAPATWIRLIDKEVLFVAGERFQMSTQTQFQEVIYVYIIPTDSLHKRLNCRKSFAVVI